VAIVKDVNGDGLDDLLIGTRSNDSNRGFVHLFFGRKSGFATNLSIGAADASFEGESQGDQAGNAVASAGDVNGDGLGDILVSARCYSGVFSNSGKAYLFLGKRTGWALNTSLAQADASFLGEATDDYAGQAAAGVGDINGDGYDDISVSGWGNDEPYVPNCNRGQVYFIFGRPSGWSRDVLLGSSNASVWGTLGIAQLGSAVAGVGDINADGYDDVAVSSNTAYSDTGATFIVFGKASGWEMDRYVDEVPGASFIGEAQGDASGYALAGLGDVTGDGIDDMAVTAPGNDRGGLESGRVYIIAGKGGGWRPKESLRNATFSIHGENMGDRAGTGVAAAGDVDGDGMDDLVCGAATNKQAGKDAGKAYVLLGRGSWTDNSSLSTSNASFVAEAANEYLGYSFGGAGDVNGDGLDDVLVGSFLHVNAYYSSGKAYLLFLENGSRPSAVSSLKVYADPSYSTPTSEIRVFEKGYIELTGTGGNSSVRDVAFVNISAGAGLTLRVRLSETGPDTGKFRGAISVWNRTSHRHDWIGGRPDDTVSISSVENPSVSTSFKVGWPLPRIAVVSENITAVEHIPYKSRYAVTGGKPPFQWSLATDASWLKWNQSTLSAEGTPLDGDVGTFNVTINATDALGRYDLRKYNLTVQNVNDPPFITSAPVEFAYELVPYVYRVIAEDPDAGTVLSYKLDISPAEMTIGPSNGTLIWTPAPSHAGSNAVVVNVSDGNASVTQQFNITVRAYPPKAVLLAPANGSRLANGIPELAWAGEDSNSPVLNFDLYLGTDSAGVAAHGGAYLVARNITARNWTPSVPLAAGRHYYWTVSVSDGYHTADAINGTWGFFIDSVPAFSSAAPTQAIDGSEYIYDVNGTDLDVGDVLLYSLVGPPAGMVIDSSTGIIRWTPLPGQVGSHNVTVRVSDGLNRCDQTFQITVARHWENSRPRISTIDDQNITAGKTFTLTVIGTDDDRNQTLTYSLLKSPVGMSIDPRSGLIEWKPAGDQKGRQEVTVQVSDGLYPVNRTFFLSVKTSGTVTPAAEFPTLLVVALLVAIVAIVGAIAVYIVHSRRKDRLNQEKSAQALSGEIQAIKGQMQTAKEEKETVEDFTIPWAFLIYDDGRFVARSGPGDAQLDEQIFSGMLMAIQSFVKDSFREEGGLDSFEFGGRRIVMVKGRYLFMVATVHGKEPTVMRERMSSSLETIEGKYAGVVENWNGEQRVFGGVEAMMAPVLGLREELKVRKPAAEVKLLSGMEFCAGFVRLKVAVLNSSETTITDASLTLTYNRDALRFEKVEPELPHEGTVVQLGAVKPGEKKTVAYYFDPLICQESNVDCTLNYLDFKGALRHADMKRRVVDIVCPLFYTKETVNVAMLRRLLSELRYTDSQIFSVSDLAQLKQAYTAAVEVVKGHDIKFVRELTELNPHEAEAWFYGEVQKSNDKMVIRVAARETRGHLELFVASNNWASLTGLLAELGVQCRKSALGSGVTLQPLTDDKARDAVAGIILLLEKAEDESPPGPASPHI